MKTSGADAYSRVGDPAHRHRRRPDPRPGTGRRATRPDVISAKWS